MNGCKGMNCGCTDGVSHSLECHAEHAACIAGGVFVKAVKPETHGERADTIKYLIQEANAQTASGKPSSLLVVSALKAAALLSTAPTQAQPQNGDEVQILTAERDNLASAFNRLKLSHDELACALAYHQEQTRPIQRTIDALASITLSAPQQGGE